MTLSLMLWHFVPRSLLHVTCLTARALFLYASLYLYLYVEVFVLCMLCVYTLIFIRLL